jgi:hypothetical protein
MFLMRKLRCVGLAFILLLSNLVQRGDAQQAASQSAAGGVAAALSGQTASTEPPKKESSPIPSPAAQPAGSFFFAYSGLGWPKRESWQNIPEFLKSRGVLLVRDPLRKSDMTSELFPISSLLNITKDIGASHLLYLTMYIQKLGLYVKLQCFDVSGRLLWEEAVPPVHFHARTRVQLDKLKKQLEPRIGTECLEK